MTPVELDTMGLRVKPLTWSEADTFGKWKFWGSQGKRYEIGRQPETLAFIVWSKGERFGSHSSLETAKAACEAHHAACIAASLEVKP